MSQKDNYDRAHQERMSEINEELHLADIPEKFVKGIASLPCRIVEEFTKTDTERKAERDAIDGRYDPPKESSGCFLSTACVVHAGLDDNCCELTALRRFRDSYVAALPNGPELLAEYYTTAPRIVRAIDSTHETGAIYDSNFKKIKGAVALIEQGENARALDIYSAIFADLKCKFAAPNRD